MKHILKNCVCMGLCLLLAGGMAGCGKAEQPDAKNATATPTEQPTITPTVAVTPTNTPEPTATPTPEPTPDSEPEPAKLESK